MTGDRLHSRYHRGGRVPLMVTVPPAMKETVQKLAARRRMSMNEWMLQLLERALADPEENAP